MWKYAQMQQRFRTSAYRHLAIIQRQLNVFVLSSFSVRFMLSVVKYLRLFRLFPQSTHIRMSKWQQQNLHLSWRCRFYEMVSTRIENRVTTWPQPFECVRKHYTTYIKLVVIMCQYYFCFADVPFLCHRISCAAFNFRYHFHWNVHLMRFA